MLIHILYFITGSQLLKNYIVEKDCFITAVYNNFWIAYKAVNKDRKVDFLVFDLEKKLREIS